MTPGSEESVAKSFVEILKAAAGEDGALVSDNLDRGSWDILIDGTFDLRKIAVELNRQIELIMDRVREEEAERYCDRYDERFE